MSLDLEVWLALRISAPEAAGAEDEDRLTNFWRQAEYATSICPPRFVSDQSGQRPARERSIGQLVHRQVLNDL